MKTGQRILALAMAFTVFYPVVAQHSSGSADLGIYVSAKKLVGDNHDQDLISPVFGIKLGYTVKPSLTLTLNGGYGWTSPMDYSKGGLVKYVTPYPDSPFKTTLIPILADVQLNLHPHSTLNPYIAGGMGMLFWDLQNSGKSVHGSQKNALVDLCCGMEWFLSGKFNLDCSLHYQRILGQDLDMAGRGDIQTGNIEFRVGISRHFGRAEEKMEEVVQPKEEAETIVQVEEKAEPVVEPAKPAEPAVKTEPVAKEEVKPEAIIKREAPVTLEGVTFATGSVVLVPKAKLTLDRVVQTLADYPEMTIEVRGYTDSVGRRILNMALSQRRADSVKQYLTGKGIDGKRIQTRGFGPDFPVASNDTAEGRAQNRRIEFIRLK